MAQHVNTVAIFEYLNYELAIIVKFRLNQLSFHFICMSAFIHENHSVINFLLFSSAVFNYSFTLIANQTNDAV